MFHSQIDCTILILLRFTAKYCCLLCLLWKIKKLSRYLDLWENNLADVTKGKDQNPQQISKS